jgi:ubiquinone/menaquinone biosynthesis C-methylase UbiE
MRGRTIAAGAALAAGGVVAWERLNPKACPYSQRWMVEVPRPFITASRLLDVLQPRSGERLLELGPGTGYYTLPVAESLGNGVLEVFDVQQGMLDHTMREGVRRGIGNIVPTQGEGSALPYPDDRFDGAFLVTVLGEIPDGNEALRELARVVRPGGRVVFGETLLDPHIVLPAKLRERAEAAGMSFDRQAGNALGYFGCFKVPA